MKTTNKRATMPSKKQILNAWLENDHDVPFDVRVCWGCGFTAPFIDRAHIVAVCDGGTSEPENLVLLCRMCHIAQETICSTETGRRNFTQAMEWGHAPFISGRIAYMDRQADLMEFEP